MLEPHSEMRPKQPAQPKKLGYLTKMVKPPEILDSSFHIGGFQPGYTRSAARHSMLGVLLQQGFDLV